MSNITNLINRQESIALAVLNACSPLDQGGSQQLRYFSDFPEKDRRKAAIGAERIEQLLQKGSSQGTPQAGSVTLTTREKVLSSTFHFFDGGVVFRSPDAPKKVGMSKEMEIGFLSQGNTVQCVALLIIQKPSSREQQEIAVLEQIREKPWAVTLLGTFTWGSKLVMIQSLCAGGDLKELLKKKTLSSEEGLFIIYQLLHSLRDLHSMGLTHRDIKPANVMIERREGPPMMRLGDFGVTCSSRSASAWEELAGTPRFLAPEVAGFFRKYVAWMQAKQKLEKQIARIQEHNQPVRELCKQLRKELETKEEEFTSLCGDVADPAIDLFSLGCACAQIIDDEELENHLFPAAVDLQTNKRMRAEIGEPPALNHPLTQLIIPLLHPDPRNRMTAAQSLTQRGLIAALASNGLLREAIAQGLWDTKTLFTDLFGDLSQEHELACQALLGTAVCQIDGNSSQNETHTSSLGHSPLDEKSESWEEPHYSPFSPIIGIKGLKRLSFPFKQVEKRL